MFLYIWLYFLLAKFASQELKSENVQRNEHCHQFQIVGGYFWFAIAICHLCSDFFFGDRSQIEINCNDKQYAQMIRSNTTQPTQP